MASLDPPLVLGCQEKEALFTLQGVMELLELIDDCSFEDVKDFGHLPPDH